MPGIYTNKKNEIVACLAAPSEAKDKRGLVWHDLPRDQWPADLTGAGGLRCWAYIDGQVSPANETERAASAARRERDRRLAALDKREIALTGRLRIARRAIRTDLATDTPEIIALEAELASLDTCKAALRDLPETAGWPHKIKWPTCKG